MNERGDMSERGRIIAGLRRARPRSRFVRWSIALMLLFTLYAWTSGEIGVLEFLNGRRLDNLRRFLSEDIRPHPLRGRDFDAMVLLAWARDLLDARGASGALATLAISVLAICLAGLAASVLAPLATRSLTTSEPYLPAAHRPAVLRRAAWNALSGTVRLVMILMRAVPEYVLAFLLLALLGPGAWPAVLALAVHNAGILGKLGAETLENLDAGPLIALRGLGASRTQIAGTAIVPLALSRCLLYFFYRFETCVREATVLGMLGIVSLGYWIQESRAAGAYDEMVFLVGLGAAIVLLADVISILARRAVRRA